MSANVGQRDDAFESSQFNEETTMESATPGVVTQDSTGVVTQDSKNIALMTWIGTIFFPFIPGLLFYLIKKDDPYIQDQAKEALNWSITAIIGYVAGFILTLILIGILVLMVVGVCHLVFCIMGAIGASNGKPFRVPFAIRLIK
ncbi:MAG: DUF4870 domain-containing protein [Gammaproteobacteria bacterium]